MQLQRSDKARLELGARVRTLSVRERGALFLADGNKTFAEMQQLLRDDGGMLQRLVADGYLVEPFTAANPPAAQVQLAPEASAADSFDGKRSLATTRMFLFDICERMFARRAPAAAQQFRDALREARDRESMLEIARQIVASVEEVAGEERADGLRERIARLLPAESVAA